jgi:YfiH family protein
MFPEIEKPSIVSRYPHLVMGQSTRVGGVSEGGYTSLNVGLHTNDRIEAVRENRTLLWSRLATAESNIAGGYQIHGSEIKKVVAPGQYDGYDAFITDCPGIMLSVTVADCVPVLIFDPVKKALAAVHAGWRGTAARLAAKTVEALAHEYGSNPTDCIAYIGTCIGFDAFEVSEDVAEKFQPAFKREALAEGKFLVDLKSSNQAQLIDSGLLHGSIEISPYCTVKDNDRFFSFRKEGGITGRMLAVIGLPL